VVTTEEDAVTQVDLDFDFEFDADADTDLMPATDVMPAVRAHTDEDWPPAPPMPATVELAQGTSRPRRNAAIYAVVRRPTTSS
jgi:hypothetical protein